MNFDKPITERWMCYIDEYATRGFVTEPNSDIAEPKPRFCVAVFAQRVSNSRVVLYPRGVCIQRRQRENRGG